ncbi:MAG TPA: heparan-alpha-glucosaminide N-acetyltransferase [Roseiarcus sp.]|nr:heparan-alpha-glucosaminide N-acetyltransferase [Roseiarcus sp.]
MSEAGSVASRAPARIVAVDFARGAALIAMAAYHLSWDLAYFGLAPPTFPVTPAMRLFSHAIAATFLALVGVSLVLAHQGAFHRKPFQRRLAIICGAAALVTLASHFLSPGNAIYFGILHCIAISSLLAAPLVEAPLAVVVAVIAVVFAAPFALANAAFNPAPVVWLGLGTILPDTFDWRPLAPWSGYVFLGLALTRVLRPRMNGSKAAEWRPKSFAAWAVAWAGRHSLAVYLIHQPVLFAILFAATSLGLGATLRTEERFRSVCFSACERGGGSSDNCQRGCQCVIDGLIDKNLTIAFTREDLDPAQQAEFSAVIHACVGKR